MSEKIVTLKEKASNDKEFQELYAKAGLPDTRTLILGKGKGKSKGNKTCNHQSCGMTRQYSKYLRHTGLTYNMKSK